MSTIELYQGEPAQSPEFAVVPESQELQEPGRKKVIVEGVFGANARNMYPALARLAMDDKHDVYGTDIAIRDDLNLPIPRDHVFMTNTEEGLEQLESLLTEDEEGNTVAYLSLIPELHVRYIEKYLDAYAKGQIEFFVVPKPVVMTLEERYQVGTKMQEAIAARKQWAESIGRPDLAQPHETPMWVHEHYQHKKAWRTLFEQLGPVAERLGRLESLQISVEESQTVESEGRVKAFGKGALADLGAHVISMALDTSYGINNAKDGKWRMSSPKDVTVQRVRYSDSELEEGVETGFVIHGTPQITARNGTETHDVDITLMGGKGLIDHKEARLTFIHPESGERNEIVVDLRKNALTVLPDAVKDLFPVTEFADKFDDNGYGKTIYLGLNGDGPEDHFQHAGQAFVVTRWEHRLAELGIGNLLEYDRDPSVLLKDLGKMGLQAA